MTFLNASLMFGLGAMAIPLVLHLIAKREPKTVPFPAIRFLTTSYQSNRSRLQVRRWWLLALRMLAMAAVAVTLARPAISRSLSTTWLSIGVLVTLGVVLLVMAAVAHSGGQSKRLSLGLLGTSLVTLLLSTIWGGATAARGPSILLDSQAPAAIAIVIDNGPTSAWSAGNESHLERHIASALEIIARLAPTSRIAILDRSGVPASFSIDMASAITQSESLSPLEVVSPMEARIDAAIRLLRTSELENRHVFVITDLAESTWAIDTNSLRSTIAQSELPVALTVIDATEFQGLNRRLGLPRLSEASPPRESPTPVSMVVSLDITESDAAAAATNAAAITAEMLLYESDPSLPLVRDGALVLPATKSVDRTSVRLISGQSAEIVLTIPPLGSGTHHGIVRLIGGDAFAPDDECHFTVRVLAPTRLLIVGSVPDETQRLAIAVNAPLDWEDANAKYAVDLIGYEDLLPTRMRDYAAAVLVDPPSQAFAGPQLSDYVAGGGGLLVCLGPSAGSTGGAPAAINNAVLPNLVRRWRAAEPGTFLQSVRPAHPVLAPLEVVTGGVPWNQYPIYQYWQLELSPSDSLLMQYASSDHAALVERVIPATGTSAPGRCLVMSTPLPALAGPAQSWNQLFGTQSWPAFWLVRGLVGYVSGRDAQSATTIVGQPQVVPLPAAESIQRVQLFSPRRISASPLDVEPGATSIIVPEVNQSGTYWLRGDGIQAGFSANLPERLVVLKRIEPSQLVDWFGADQYTVVTDIDAIDLSRGGQAQSILLQSPAMLLALVIFLLEQVLSNRFYRSSTAVAAGQPTGKRVSAA